MIGLRKLKNISRHSKYFPNFCQINWILLFSILLLCYIFKPPYPPSRSPYSNNSYFNFSSYLKYMLRPPNDTQESPIIIKNTSVVLKTISSEENTPANRNSPRECPDHFMGVPESFRRLQWCKECQEVTCHKLLYSDAHINKTFYKNVKHLLKRTSKYVRSFNDTDLEKLIDFGCSSYKLLRLYDLSPPKLEELLDSPVSDLKEYRYSKEQILQNISSNYDSHNKTSSNRQVYSIAFNILVHDNFEQAERFIRAIYRPQHYICVHVDLKNQVLLAQVKKLIKCFDNIYLPSKLESVVYQSMSRLMADIHCMKEHLKRGGSWKYIFNSAATAFPLKSSVEMVQILKIYNGSNDVVTIDTNKSVNLKSRFKYEHLIKFGEMIKLNKLHPPPPHNLTIVKGSAYGGFSRKFVEFMLTNKMASDLLFWCNGTLTPDEHFWNTLHHTYSNPQVNAPGGNNGTFDKIQSGPTFVIWPNNHCHGFRLHSVCLFGVQDLPSIMKSKKFIANKFDRNFEPVALECLDNWMQYKRICPGEINLAYYKEMEFIKSWRDRI